MNEHSLHSAVKQWYALPGDKFEVSVEDFVVDIVRGGLLIEIQTRNFSAPKKKLKRLIREHCVRLVYPIARRKWIVRVAQSGEMLSRRRSPKKGRLIDLFYELVRIPDMIKNQNFSLEILMIREEEVRCNDGKGSWRRRGASIRDRKLIDVIGRMMFKDEKDFLRFKICKRLDYNIICVKNDTAKYILLCNYLRSSLPKPLICSNVSATLSFSKA